jgi:hypothetical protein
MNVVEAHDDYYKLSRNAANQVGLSCFLKVTATFRMLTYEVSTDATYEYVRIGESTAIESLIRFVEAITKVFGEEYLRSPTESDTTRLLALGGRKRFSRYAWFTRLYALEVEELPFDVARYVFRPFS